jgi:NAD(P)-dependent dehydrogenase (short-subunit alcohol dehydrogenase family)
MIEAQGRRCVSIKADVRSRKDSFEAIDQTLQAFGKLNILINYANFQKTDDPLKDKIEEKLMGMVETNLFNYFFVTQAVLPHLHEGDAIVNIGSIIGLTGYTFWTDYTTTKNAIYEFTKSLAFQVANRNVRVNAVIPGPLRTNSVPGAMRLEEVENFGYQLAVAQPSLHEALTPICVVLASSNRNLMTGSLIEVTGGGLFNKV